MESQHSVSTSISQFTRVLVKRVRNPGILQLMLLMFCVSIFKLELLMPMWKGTSSASHAIDFATDSVSNPTLINSIFDFKESNFKYYRLSKA